MPLNDWLARCYAELGQEAMRRVTLSELFDSIDLAARARELSKLTPPRKGNPASAPPRMRGGVRQEGN